MKYLLILNINPDVLAALPAEEQQAIGAGHQKFMDTIKASGEFHSTVALQQPAQSSVVKVRNGVPAVTDGPFVESKEFLGGYYLVDVASRDRAHELAAMIPDAGIEGLGVEVRGIEFADGI
ncbi:YciI family protein [Kribbella sp. HUAS MG21]|uniref:YciI family protein n=1 Tax=Kribbella sp. HUAS MG21 TaxID=3160966 RepID=A0AAU7TIN4_9ACTN